CHYTHHTVLRMLPPPPRSTLFPYTTLFRSALRRPEEGLASGNARFEIHFEKTRRHHPGRRGVPMMPMLAELQTDEAGRGRIGTRSEEHTSELQSRENLVCRLLLEKKKKNKK